MKKRIAITLILFVLSISTIAQDDGISPELEIHLDGLEAQTEALRGLDELENVTRLFPTRDDLLIYLDGVFETELTQGIIDEEMAFYAAFDFIDPALDLRATLLDLYGQQIAGYYDTDTEEMNTILLTGEQPGDALPLLERITYVHEFVHALQDQHFGLDALLESTDTVNADRTLAIISLVEGDASFVMNAYTVREAEANPLGSMLSLLAGGLQSGNLAMPPGIPAIIEAELLFPYLTGEQFVNAIYVDGGWDAVNALYDNPPQSSEHILHPETFLAGEMPLEVSLSVTLPDNWTLLREDVMGEFYLREYLATQLSTPIATAAATGWAGSAYQVYENENDDMAWILSLALDSEADTVEFVDAYTEFMSLRLPDAAMNDNCAVSTETLCMQVNNTSVLIAYAPDETLARTLLEE
ncbi:MAG: hypothetical protein ACPG7F_15850 [Aggregatilineales bacterium]